MSETPTEDRHEASIVPVAVATGTDGMFAGVGGLVRGGTEYLGGLSRLGFAALKVLHRRPLGFSEIVAQCEAIGVKSMTIATLIMFFVGLVFALQFGLTLQTMGAVPYL